MNEKNETKEGVFHDLKECEAIFLDEIQKKNIIDVESIVGKMNALEQKFLREYPWAFEKNYFIMPNLAFKQILMGVESHKYKVFEMYKGEWKESPNTKDLHYFDEIPKNKPFVLYKVMTCNDFIGVLKEREFAGSDECALGVFTEFSILQRITYESMNGELQSSFKKNLEEMSEGELIEFIPKTIVHPRLKVIPPQVEA